MSKPTFCYLLTNTEPSKNNHAFIGSSQFPYDELENHNKGKHKQTKQGAPHWIMEAIVGEFQCEEDGILFLNRWSKKYGKKNRLKAGMELACAWKATCWLQKTQDQSPSDSHKGKIAIPPKDLNCKP